MNLIKSVFRRIGFLPYFYNLINKIFPSFESLNPDNLKVLKKAFLKSSKGDYYEFGVYKGFSFWFAMEIADILNIKKMHFWGFDSFEGLPTPQGVDKKKILNKSTFAKGNFTASKDFVNNFLIKYGSDSKYFTLIKGFYKDILNDNLKKNINSKKLQ